MDGVDNLEEKTREDADIRMCPFGCIFLYRGCDAVVMVSWWTSKFFFTFNKSDNVEVMWFGGQRPGGWQGQP